MIKRANSYIIYIAGYQKIFYGHGMYVRVFMALVTAMVLCARSQDSLMSVSVRRVHVVFSTARFRGGGKPCPKTRVTNALRRGIQKVSCIQPCSNPSHRCISSRLCSLSYPSALEGRVVERSANANRILSSFCARGQYGLTDDDHCLLLDYNNGNTFC